MILNILPDRTYPRIILSSSFESGDHESEPFVAKEMKQYVYIFIVPVDLMILKYSEELHIRSYYM